MSSIQNTSEQFSKDQSKEQFSEDQFKDESEDESVEEAEVEEDDAESKPNFYEVIEELKKKNQNKKDKNISFSDNSNNSFILNNR